MSKKLTPQPNTFYIKQPITKDISIRRSFPDSYDGTQSAGLIDTGSDRKFYLASSVMPSIPEYMSSMSLFSESFVQFYPSTVTSTSNFSVPRLKLYKAKDSLELTEGKLDVIGDSDRVVAFSTYVDWERGRITDDFGGTNVGFGDREWYSKEIRENVSDPSYMYYEIGGKKYKEFLEDSGYFANGKGWWKESPHKDSTIVLKKGSPVGVYWPHSTDGKETRDSSWYKTGDEEEPWMKEEDEAIAMTVSDLETYGATPQGGSYQWNPQTPQQFDIYDTQFTGRVTQFNSIFNYVKESPDAEDIKVQSVGTTGDDDKFYTYSRFMFNTSDKLSGGSSAHIKNFWENYTGTSNRYAKYFGTNAQGVPFPQQVMASIDYFPQPVPLDFTGPSNCYNGSGFSGQSDPGGTVESQMDDSRLNGSASEIEIGMKIEKMPPVMYVNPVGVIKPNMRFNRGYYIIFSEALPNKEENFYEFIRRCNDEEAASTGIMVFKNRQVDADGQEGLQVVPFLDAKYPSDSASAPITFSGTTGNYDVWSTYTGSSGTNPASNWPAARRMEVPENKWFTLRFKFTAIPPSVSSGSRILAYCPDVLNDDGVMENMVLNPGHWPKVSGSYLDFNSISMWGLNFRSVAADGDSTSTNADVNMLAEETGFIDDDQEQSVLIDSFSFINFNNIVNNATICENNNAPMPMRLKYDTTVPMWAPKVGDSYEPVITPSDTSAVGVNYFGERSIPVQNNFCYGFDELPTLTGDAVSIMMNGYGAVGPTTLTPHWYFISGTYSYNSGNPVSGGAVTRNGMHPAGYGSTVSEDTAGYFNVSGGTNSIDAFKQKGFFAISGAFANATKRENWLVSARVLRANKDGTEITVDNPSIFDLPLGEASAGGTDYVMWAVDDPSTDGNRKILKTSNLQDGTASIGYGTNPSLYQVSKRKGNTIKLNRKTDVSDSGNNNMCATNPDVGAGTMRYQAGPGARKPRLASIFISPKKYWFNLHMIAAKPEADPPIAYKILPRKWGAWYAPADVDSGYQYGNKDPWLYEVINTRSWTSALLVSGTVQNKITDGTNGYVGSTFNEYLFTDGNTQQRAWDIGNAKSGLLQTDIDYGFGVYTDATDDTPQHYGGYINENFPASGAFNFLDATNFVREGSPDWDVPFNFSIYPFFEDTSIDNAYYKVNLYNREGGTYKPSVIWGLYCPLIEIDDIRVSPAIDVLAMENPLNESAVGFSDVKFEWTESEKPWYRLLWADTIPVTNKYHQANLIIPLNENPGDRTYQSSPAESYFYFYSSSADFSTKNQLRRKTFKVYNRIDDGVASYLKVNSMYSQIEGFQGYGLSGAVNLNHATNNLTIGAADQFTFITHLVPTDTYTPSAGYGTIFRASTSAGTDYESFGIKINENKKIEAHMNNSGATVTSTTSFDIDGVQPIMVAVTYNKNRDVNNLRLIIDGQIEDTANYTTNFSSTDNHIYLGYNRGYPVVQDIYVGRMEETTFHKKEAFFPPNNSEFILNTDTLPDLNGNNSNVYQSRMFAIDYHNIRGVSPKEVTRSDVASWKVVSL